MNIFEQTILSPEIKKAIEELNFFEPTPIQKETIPLILNSTQDIIALAQTGTGKTAGFGLPIIQQINPNSNQPQALILSPTRELAIQINKDIERFTKYIKNFNSVAVYGGENIQKQIKKLKQGVQIAVGTPGRTLDLIRKKALKINNIKWLVLDEADEMLNMGFKEELDEILKNTPPAKQNLLFSATMPDGIKEIAENYLYDPIEIAVAKRNIAAENISHYCYTVKASNRYLALKRIADFNPKIYGIIFCRTRYETKDVASNLMQDGYNADALHGDLSQAQRDYVMEKFRKKQIQLLVATDVAARGLDIDNLTHIINYNLPDDPEVYVHRSGRTGRVGRKGISIIITQPGERRKVKAIQKIIGKKFEDKKVPQGEEICEKRLYNLMDKIENILVDEQKIEPYLPQIQKKLQWLDRDELLKRFVYVGFEQFLNYYKNAKDLNAVDEKREKKEKKKKRKYTELFLNIGKSNNLKHASLLGIINETTNTNNIEIGKIDIQKNFTFFEVDDKYKKLVIDSMTGTKYGSAKLKVELTKASQGKSAQKPQKKRRKNRRKK